MTRLEPATKIEGIVGVRRYVTRHIGRAISAEQRVYILHSQACLDTGIDLRRCAFSIALDRRIRPADWAGVEDRPVVLGIDPDTGLLVPVIGVDA